MCPMCFAATAWAVVGATSAGGALAFVAAKFVRSQVGRKAAAFIVGKLRGAKGMTATSLGHSADSAANDQTLPAAESKRHCCAVNNL